jgi:4-amino-4-deoxy-L-arabinose transferase-like glycosyltransferase
VNTISDIPAHPFFVHFVVVLAPLVAILVVLCAVWTAARERLVWLTLALAVALTVLTPLATEAGEWLEHQQKDRTPTLHQHTELGDTAIYFVLGLLVVSLALAFLHRWGTRLGDRRGLAGVVVTVLAVVIGVATIYQIVRIGDSGARAVWGSGGS